MKKITLLFAIMACSFCLLNAANVNVHLLIPTDSEFSTDGDVVFSWTAYTSGGSIKSPQVQKASQALKVPQTPKRQTQATNILLTREGTSRWWSATVIIPDETRFTYDISTETSSTTSDKTFIMGSSPDSYVAKDKPELYLELLAMADADAAGNRIFACAEVAAETEDHDYSITSWDVQDIGNGVTITWTANNLAPSYAISIMDDTYSWFYDDYITVTEEKFTYNYTGTEDLHIGTIVFYPCYYDGTDMLPYVQMFEKDVDINFKGIGKIIEESLKAVEKDNTIEISWQHAGDVTRYDVQIEYAFAPFKDFTVLPEYMPAADGKYTLTVDGLKGNGVYDISFFALDAGGYMIAEAYPTVTVSGLPALGDVELNALIPSDNDMDITFGVWFEWWDVETETHAFVKADQDAGGVWFTKTITTDKSAIRFRVCNTPDASGSNSTSSPIISTNKACFEMQYQRWHAWELEEADCDAPDHDYRITHIEAESLMGTLKITLTANDYAPYYQLEARKNGVGAYYQTIAYAHYEGNNAFLFAMPFTEKADYDYRVTPLNENSQQVAESVEGTIEIYPNIYIPSNLQAVVDADQQTVTFTWDQASSLISVDHYTLAVGDLEFKNITGTTFTQKFYLSGNHYWSLYVYTSNDVLLAEAHSDDSFEIITPYYDPQNLQVTVSGKQATMTWEAHADVAASNIILYEIGGDIMMNSVVNANEGKFTATYTLSEERTVVFGWFVTAYTASGEQMSYDIAGPMFAITGSASTDIEEMAGTPEFVHTMKVLRNGQILIIRDGKTYDMTGRVVAE